MKKGIATMVALVVLFVGLTTPVAANGAIPAAPECTFAVISETRPLGIINIEEIVGAPNGDIWMVGNNYLGEGGGILRRTAAGELQTYGEEVGLTTTAHDVSISNNGWVAVATHDYLLETEGGTWFKAGGLGIYYPDTAHWAVYNSWNSDLPDEDFWSVAWGGDTVYLGTEWGNVVLFDPETKAVEVHQLPVSHSCCTRVIDIETVPSGSVWVATEDGAFSFTEEEGWVRRSAEPTFSIVTDGMDVWLGTDQGAVHIVNGEETLIAMPRVYGITLGRGGNPWFATAEGIYTPFGTFLKDREVWSVWPHEPIFLGAYPVLIEGRIMCHRRIFLPIISK